MFNSERSLPSTSEIVNSILDSFESGDQEQLSNGIQDFHICLQNTFKNKIISRHFPFIDMAYYIGEKFNEIIPILIYLESNLNKNNFVDNYIDYASECEDDLNDLDETNCGIDYDVCFKSVIKIYCIFIYYKQYNSTGKISLGCLVNIDENMEKKLLKNFENFIHILGINSE